MANNQLNGIKDNGSLHKYRTEIPNIVLDIGLSSIEIVLYLTLKRTAGDNGECWKSTTTLAKESGLSAGAISKAKILLAQPRPELGGKPLINLAERPNPHGGNPLHYITIVDVWPENMARYSKSEEGSRSPSEHARSPYERAPSSRERADSPHELARSPGETKKEPIKKEPIKKEPNEESSSKHHDDDDDEQTQKLKDSIREVVRNAGALPSYASTELYLIVVEQYGWEAFARGMSAAVEQGKQTVPKYVQTCAANIANGNVAPSKATHNGRESPKNYIPDEYSDIIIH